MLPFILMSLRWGSFRSSTLPLLSCTQIRGQLSKPLGQFVTCLGWNWLLNLFFFIVTLDSPPVWVVYPSQVDWAIFILHLIPRPISTSRRGILKSLLSWTTNHSFIIWKGDWSFLSIGSAIPCDMSLGRDPPWLPMIKKSFFYLRPTS